MRKTEFVYIEGLQWDNLPINKKTLDLVFFIMSGGEIKPIKLIKSENGYKVVNGRHRIAAYKLLGKKMILAKYYKPKKIKQDGRSKNQENRCKKSKSRG